MFPSRLLAFIKGVSNKRRYVRSIACCHFLTLTVVGDMPRHWLVHRFLRAPRSRCPLASSIEGDLQAFAGQAIIERSQFARVPSSTLLTTPYYRSTNARQSSEYRTFCTRSRVLFACCSNHATLRRDCLAVLASCASLKASAPQPAFRLDSSQEILGWTAATRFRPALRLPDLWRHDRPARLGKRAGMLRLQQM